ncbi:MAG: hypothetical protein QW265_01310 [Candidatus Bathyarchaeia archaeon]
MEGNTLSDLDLLIATSGGKDCLLLTFDEDSLDKAAQVMSSLLKAGKPINVIDVLIAGIALANGVEDIITKDEN